MDDTSPAVTAPLTPLPAIIQRYLDGESITDLAKEHGKSFRTIYNWLLTDKGAAYEDLISECLTNRIADADLSLELAADSVQLARAREMVKFARMDFERRRPKLYGIKQEMSTDNRITVIVQRERPQPVVVEAQTLEGQVVSTQNDESRQD